MAVFKATSYTKNKAYIKGSVWYISHRLGKDGEQITLDLFNQDGSLDQEQAYRMITNAEEDTYFYRLVISPDKKIEDTYKDLDLREITERTMTHLEEMLKGLQNQVHFFAAEHNDRDHRHTHIIALLKRKLNVAELEKLRDVTTEAALSQRQELDLAQRQSQEQAITVPAFKHANGRAPAAKRYSGSYVNRSNVTQAKPRKAVGQTCPRCAPGTAMKILADDRQWCPRA